eukprot:COSAG02_NODE_5075_length_4661_cov_4.005261_1_plen_227_part_00
MTFSRQMSKGGQNSDALNARLVNLDAIRKNANKVLTKINAQHEKARSKGTQLSEKQVEKLRGLYEQAYTLSQDERQVAIAAAELVSDLINTGKRKSEGGAPRGKKRRGTAVQQHPISEGAMVAANNEGQWILGRVQEFDFSSQTVRCLPILFELCVCTCHLPERVMLTERGIVGAVQHRGRGQVRAADRHQRHANRKHLPRADAPSTSGRRRRPVSFAASAFLVRW